MNQTLKLKNIFNGEIVYCNDIHNVKSVDGYNFVSVFAKENVNRFFLVNLDAYKIETK